jgi:hypothetical protein
MKRNIQIMDGKDLIISDSPSYTSTANPPSSSSLFVSSIPTSSTSTPSSSSSSSVVDSQRVVPVSTVLTDDSDLFK